MAWGTPGTQMRRLDANNGADVDMFAQTLYEEGWDELDEAEKDKARSYAKRSITRFPIRVDPDGNVGGCPK